MIRTLVAACAVLAAAAAHAQTPPREAYTHLPDMAAAEISPNGRMIAAYRPHEGTQALFIYNTGEMAEPVRVIKAPEDMFLSGLTWASDNYVLMQARETRKIQTMEGMFTFTESVVVSVDVERGKANVLLSGERVFSGSLGNILSYLPDDPEHIIMLGLRYDASSARSFTRVNASGGHFELAVFRANLGNSGGRRLDTGSDNTIDLVTHPDGSVIARVNYDPETRVYEIFRASSGFDSVYRKEDTPIRPFTVVGALDDSSLVVDAYGEDGFSGLFELNMDEGMIERIATAPDGHDVDYAIVDPFRNEIAGYAYRDDFSRQHYFDEELEKYRAALDKALPDEHVSLTSWTRDRKRFLVYAEGPRFSGSYSLFDTETGQLEVIGFNRPMLPPEKMAQVEAFEFEARDGMTIPAYVTYPLNADPASGPFPTVILPHGGPESRDTAGFDWIAQFLASRGYAVLQPNFRGSSGYGADFRDAGYGQWGAAMIDDIVDSANAMAAQGIADPQRMCALGASYGGFAALSLGMRDDLALDCVISANGVTHLPMLANETLAGGNPTEGTNYLKLYMGDRITDDARLRAWSPALNAAAYDEPVLLVHAEDDTTVSYDHAGVMRAALEDAGADFDFVTLKGDDHYFASERSREEFAALVENFLAENLR